ncbi:MAG: prolipoprotein diacylglyceryl transferase family protein [Pyrinomonadaceae bacterium]
MTLASGCWWPRSLARRCFCCLLSHRTGAISRSFSLSDFLRSGGVFYGGFIGAVIVGYLLIRRYGLPWWQTADAFAPGIALGQAIGRQGCFAAGCCWGKPTTLPWGVMFSERGHQVTGVPIDVHLHPTQLYESFASLAIFFFSSGCIAERLLAVR